MNKGFIAALIFTFTSSLAFADFDKGVAAYAANDLPLALKEFQSAAEKGDADAQFNLGLMYEQGLGTSKNEAEALTWYQKSAELGNMYAQYNVGVFYENGRGTSVNYAQANQWYRKAVAQGDAFAIGNLGMLYVRAQGVAENKIAGLALLMFSATLDSSPENHAKQNIATIKGLSADMVSTAQTLSTEMASSKKPLFVLDRFIATGK